MKVQKEKFLAAKVFPSSLPFDFSSHIQTTTLRVARSYLLISFLDLNEFSDFFGFKVL